MVIVIMGVSGSGKSLIGASLARALGWQFADADDYHPFANVEKMRHGQPLSDQDRLPWLVAVAEVMDDWVQKDIDGVIACSALKEEYRRILTGRHCDRMKFAYLKGSFELLQKRLMDRQHHFMKANMLKSQFETLEEPQAAIVIDASLPPDKIVDELLDCLEKL